MKRSTLRRRTRRLLRRSPRYVLLSMLWSLAACSGFLQFQSCDGNCSHAYNGQPGSCPESGGESGEPGGPCNGIECDGDARCVNNTCLPCGGQDQVCCAPILETPDCNSGFTCAGGGTWGGGYGMCTSSCGLLGLSCCEGDGTECSQGVCSPDSKTCVDPSGTEDLCQGSAQFVGYGLNAAGCVEQQFNFSANGSAAATQCLAMMTAQQGLTASALNATEYPSTFCEENIINGNSTVYVNVTNPAQLSQCEQSLCTNCTIVAGACP